MFRRRYCKSLKLRGHVQHFSSTRSNKTLQHFFSENVTLGAYLQHAAILDFCSKKNVATFVQQNQISLILLQFICNIFNVCSTIFLSAAYFRVAHMCCLSLQQILLWFCHRHVYYFINSNGFSRRKHEIDWRWKV